MKHNSIFGEHLTPTHIFTTYILPEIQNEIHQYRWSDMFCGEGNLILPMLDLVPEQNRNTFFKNHILMYDIQEKMVEKAVENAVVKYGVSEEIARTNIILRNTLKDYPEISNDDSLPIYHITNPPYLYVGHIKKHIETKHYLEYFKDENRKYQDLYQLAMMNDLRHGIKKMIYIIPVNFLYGASVSNRIRNDFLRYYDIKKAVIFEKRIFEFTFINVMICFFERKQVPERKVIMFEGIRVNNDVKTKNYILKPENHYRAGAEFDEFVKNHRTRKPLQFSFYLTTDEIEKGEHEITVVDANKYVEKGVSSVRGYSKKVLHVSESVFRKIKNNILFIRTTDTGAKNGGYRAGLYVIRDVFDADGILVTKAKYRTQPVQLFFYNELTIDDQLLLKDYFNLILEHFRNITDSEFMTTYKYANTDDVVRKYLGLSQVKKLIETFPLLAMDNGQKKEMKKLIESQDAEKIVEFVEKL